MSDQATDDVHGEARSYRASIAALVAAAAAIAFYAVDRTRAAVARGPYDPDAVPSSLRIEYFWRMMLAGFIASVVFHTVSHVARRAPGRAVGWATAVVVVCVAAAAALSAVFP